MGSIRRVGATEATEGTEEKERLRELRRTFQKLRVVC